MTPGKGSKYREFYDLSGRITCMQNSLMCLKANFMQNYFSNTTKTSFFSSFLLNTCYFVVSYFNGKYVVFSEI